MHSHKMLRFVIGLVIIISLHSFTNAITNNNVLLIVIDDLRHLSSKNVKLPNMSKMAARGVNFENAFAQQSLCAPSRNSFLTGRRPDSLRLYDFYSYWRDSIANFTTLPQFFKEHGYETVSVGKIFHPGKSSNFTDDYPHSWSRLPYHPPSQRYKDSAVCKDHLTKKLQKNLICPVVVSKQPGRILPDLESLDYAVNFLESRNDSAPYFLAVGFHKPHIPIKFPREFLSKIPISEVDPPRHPDIPTRLPLTAWHPWTDVRRRDDIKRLNITFPFGIMPRKWTLKIRQSYFAAALYVDSLIGKLMSYVDLRKTIVLLTSDHGWSLGENGLWAKYSNFDVALRVPLIIMAPNLRAQTITAPVELIDIFPTLVHLTELPHNIPQCRNNLNKTTLCFEGKNLIQFMQNQKATKTYAISQYPRPSNKPQKNSDKPRLKDIKIMGYSIKTRRYRYTEWASFNNTSFLINWNKLHGLELYDHILDPDESNNLYLEPEYARVINELSKMLRSQVEPDQSNYS